VSSAPQGTKRLANRRPTAKTLNMKPTTPNWQNEQSATVHFADATEAMDYLRSRGWTWERAIPAGSVWAHPRVCTHNYWLRSGSVAEAGPDTWTITAISRC